YSGFYIAWLEWNTIVNAALWLPLILLSIFKFFENGKVKWFLLLTLALTQTVFAGHTQTTMYVFTASIIYLGFAYSDVKNTKRLFFLTIAYILAFLVVLPQIVPAFEFINRSARTIDQGYFPGREDWFIPIQNLVQMMVPDYFGNPTTYNYWGVWNYGEFVSFAGLTTIYFVLISLFRKKIKPYLFLITLLLFSLVLAVKNPLSVLPYTLNLPLVSTLQPSRIIFLIDFALCALGAFGLQIFLTKKENLKNSGIALGIFISVLILGVFTYSVKNIFPLVAGLDTQNIALRNLFVPIVSSGAILSVVLASNFIKKRNVLALVFLLLVMSELFRFSNKFLPFTKESLIYPKTEIVNILASQNEPFRIITTDRRIMHPNISGVYGIESIDGFDPLYLKSYGQFVSSWQGNKYTDKSNSFNRIITPSKIDGPIINLLNTKYVLSFDTINVPGFEKVQQEGQTMLYKNNNALPRLYFVSSIVKTSPEEEFNKLLEKGFIEKNATSQETEFTSPDSMSAITIKNYKDNYLKSEVNTNVPKPLILSNVYYPGWKAFVDNRQVQIYKVDSILQAIIVPAGSHTIEFIYSDRNYQVSFVGSFFGILAIVLVSFYLWFKPSRS
ncbi:YfhO family protein, partial [Candidatus Curtissbacteria bacterium]|nr:YfhO family protein [Candidatus Curtissbacteria bacterium]